MSSRKSYIVAVACLLLATSGKADLILHYDFDADQSAGGTVENKANRGTYDGLLNGNAYTSGVRPSSTAATIGSTRTFPPTISPRPSRFPSG